MTALHRLPHYRRDSELFAEVATTPAAYALGSGVHGDRLDVATVPALASHRGRGPALTLRWNDMVAAPAQIDVVVHLHGYSRQWLNLTRDIEPYSGLDLTPVDGGLGQGRTRPTLTLLPRGHFTGVKQTRGPLYVYTFPALDGSDGRRDGLTRLVQFSLERFADVVRGPAPRISRLILTAHSGGGAPLLRILRFQDPHEVHVFDALYWDPTSLADWARRHIGIDRASGTGTAGAMRVFHGAGTGPYSRRLLGAISPALGGSDNRYRIEATPLGHWEIPRNYGWRVLADAAVDVPRAVRDAVSRRQPYDSRELEFGPYAQHEVEVTRRPGPAPPRRPGRPVVRLRPAPRRALATANNYIALFNGFNELVQHWQSPSPGDLALGQSRPADLLPRHRELLVKLRDALLLRGTSQLSAARSALTAWGALQPALETELRRAGLVGAGGDLSWVHAQLDYLDKRFASSAFYEAKAAARAASDLPAPDIVLVDQKLKRAEADFKRANDLLEKTQALGGELAHDDPRLRGALSLLPIISLPGTINEKLEAARQGHIASTGTELLSKVLEAEKSLVELSSEIGKYVYEARRAAAVAKGLTDVAKQMQAVVTKFETLAEGAKRIGQVASAAALIGDGIKFVDALHDDDYHAALSATGDFLKDLAPLAFGEELAGPLAIGTVTVQAVLESIRMAADIIRSSKIGMARDAASAFIKKCDDVATRRGGAYDLVADVQLILFEEPAIAQLAARAAEIDGKVVAGGLKELYQLTVSRDPHDLGGQGLVQALGKAANDALSPFLPDDPLSVAQRIATVFAGANLMALYVRDYYQS